MHKLVWDINSVKNILEQLAGILESIFIMSYMKINIDSG